LELLSRVAPSVPLYVADFIFTRFSDQDRHLGAGLKGAHTLGRDGIPLRSSTKKTTDPAGTTERSTLVILAVMVNGWREATAVADVLMRI
jgi:hypothetical protein